MHGTSFPAPSTRLRRTIAGFALLTLIPLRISGALGDALSFTTIIFSLVALSILCAVIPRRRLDATLRLVFIAASFSTATVIADNLLRTFASRFMYYRGHTEFPRKDPQYPALPRYVSDADSKRITFGDLAAI